MSAYEVPMGLFVFCLIICAVVAFAFGMSSRKWNAEQDRDAAYATVTEQAAVIAEQRKQLRERLRPDLVANACALDQLIAMKPSEPFDQRA